jgi:hypothetical protein
MSPCRSSRASILLIVFGSEPAPHQLLLRGLAVLGQGRQEDELVDGQAEPRELGVRPAVHSQVGDPQGHRQTVRGPQLIISDCPGAPTAKDQSGYDRRYGRGGNEGKELVPPSAAGSHWLGLGLSPAMRRPA